MGENIGKIKTPVKGGIMTEIDILEHLSKVLYETKVYA